MDSCGTIEVENKGTDLRLHFKGRWAMGSTFPPFVEIQPLLTGVIEAISFDTTALQAWDSRFLIILNDINEYAAKHKITIRIDGLPSGAQRLFKLSSASPEKTPFKPEAKSLSFLATVGDKTTHLIEDCGNLLSFTGTISLSYLRLFSARPSSSNRIFSISSKNAAPPPCPLFH